MTENTAIGIDIGGTGIKGAVVNLVTGELVSERVKMTTPEGGQPEDCNFWCRKNRRPRSASASPP